MKHTASIWYYIVFSILLVLGLICIIPVAYTKGEQTWYNIIFGNLSGTLIVGAALSILFKVFKDREDIQNLRRLFRLHDSVDDLGLCEIIPESQSFSYVKFLRESVNVSILMNDGKRWVGNNSVELEDRFSNDTKTIFISISPESDFLPILAKKTDIAVESLKEKIHETRRLLRDSYNNSHKKGILKIYETELFPTKSIFISEHQLIETPYQTAKGRVKIPVFIYKKVEKNGNLWNFAEHDIEQLLKVATEIPLESIK